MQLDARRWVERLALPLAVALVAVAYADTLRQGFAADARFLIADNRYLDSWSFFRATLVHDYFWSSSGASISYWRPLTKLSWLVEARLFGRGAALPFHAVQLVWLATAAAGVGVLARRLGATAAWAALAVLLFGLHPALVEAGCLLMARSDVAVVACTSWALVGWIRWRQGAPAWAVVHVVALAGALLSKEAAVVLPAVLTVWAVASSPRRLATVAPAWLLTIAYLVARRLALGAAPSASFDALRIFVGVGVYGWGLLPLRVATGVRNLSFAEAHAPATIAMATIVWLLLALGIVVAWRRRSATALGLIALALASLLPVLLGPTPSVPGIAGKYAFADRWLVTAAAAASLGLVLAAMRLPLRGRRLVAGVLALWCVAASLVARTAHSYYVNDAALLDLEDEGYEATPERFRTVEDRCRFRERLLVHAAGGDGVDAALAVLRDAPPECPPNAMMRFNVAQLLAQKKRFAEARPIADDLLANFAMPARYHAPLLYLDGVAALRTGDPARSERLLTSALGEGFGSCSIFARLAEATGAQGRADDAARWKQRLDACR